MENLVRKYLEEINLISPDMFIDKFFIQGDEWEIYHVSNDGLLYVFFELTEDGWGYAWCVKIACKKMTYDMDCFYHVKCFDNTIREEWKDCSQYIRDRLMYDAINRLKVYEK